MFSEDKRISALSASHSKEGYFTYVLFEPVSWPMQDSENTHFTRTIIGALPFEAISMKFDCGE